MGAPKTTYSGPDLCRLSAREVVAKLKAGEVSPEECLDAALERISAVEPAINATPTTCEDRARKSFESLAQKAKKEGRRRRRECSFSAAIFKWKKKL